MKQKFLNWLLKQVFYLRYLVLKQGSPNWQTSGPCHYILPKDEAFYSKSFDDLQWNRFLPWKFPQSWNTYNIFSQQYGKFYFKTKMGEYIKRQPYFLDIIPAMWLLEYKTKEDVIRGIAEHPYYFEVDIELMRNDLSYTIHVNHTGEQDKTDPNYHVVHSKLRNKRLYRRLQKEYHLFLIDWSEDWIKMYVNGIKTAQFQNEIHIPMQIICSKISVMKIIVKT